VPVAEDWNAVVAQLRASTDPLRSPHLPRLYELALADGPRLLSSFRRRLGEERIIDLVHDLLAAKVDAIIAAEEPRALFCTALQRRAISWLRRGDAEVVADEDATSAADAVTAASSSPASEDSRRGFILDAKTALDGLPERERAMVVAVALGEERESIARAFGTSRANVDQIVSRVRRRFSEETG
jgi:DNA-directed RNA polymerase specialized sigma24 family protein